VKLVFNLIPGLACVIDLVHAVKKLRHNIKSVIKLRLKQV